jgi:hypothetical protein
MLEVVRGTLHGIPLPGPTIRRPERRRKPAAPSVEDEGTPVLRLVGVAVLGWFGLMAVVTLLAV